MHNFDQLSIFHTHVFCSKKHVMCVGSKFGSWKTWMTCDLWPPFSPSTATHSSSSRPHPPPGRTAAHHARPTQNAVGTCNLPVPTLQFLSSKPENGWKWQDHRFWWPSGQENAILFGAMFGGPYSLATLTSLGVPWGLGIGDPWVSLVPWGTPKYTHHRSYYTKCHVWRYYSNRFQTNPNKRLLVDVGCASYIISHILLNPSKSHNKSVVSFRKKKTVTLPSAELLAWLLLRAPLDSHLHLIEGDPARAGVGMQPRFFPPLLWFAVPTSRSGPGWRIRNCCGNFTGNPCNISRAMP